MWIATIFSVGLYIYSPDDPGAMSNIVLAIVLVLIILVTGFITYQQTAKSQALMDSFKNMIPQQCIVIREGIEK